MERRERVLRNLMRKYMRRTAATALLFFILIIAAACAARQAGTDELTLKIKLNLKEDIGLLLIDWQFGGEEGSGGMSNADKTLISKDETLWFKLDKERFETDGRDTMEAAFTISTEYFDPNYENDYPQEYLIKIKPLEFEAAFGNTYDILISEEDGYSAALLS